MRYYLIFTALIAAVTAQVVPAVVDPTLPPFPGVECVRTIENEPVPDGFFNFIQPFEISESQLMLYLGNALCDAGPQCDPGSAPIVNGFHYAANGADCELPFRSKEFLGYELFLYRNEMPPFLNGVNSAAIRTDAEFVACTADVEKIVKQCFTQGNPGWFVAGRLTENQRVTEVGWRLYDVPAASV